MRKALLLDDVEFVLSYHFATLALPPHPPSRPTSSNKLTALFKRAQKRQTSAHSIPDNSHPTARTALVQGVGLTNTNTPSSQHIPLTPTTPHPSPSPMISAHPQNTHIHQPSSANANAKASLKAWWNHFNFVQRAKKESNYIREYEKGAPEDHPVFGKPLHESLQYASVPISTASPQGDLYVWGFVPVVVAKCGLYLKENATEVPGTFRVNGSNKRMRELQQIFEAPPKYGKHLNWRDETFTTHDVASVFRRYLTQMPEPVIPHSLYHKFRDAIAHEPYNQEQVIATYKSLIRSMAISNQYLLLYVLDLLSVFARKSDINLMTAQNLAVIFRPGILSHPTHEMLPHEHALSQRVVEFLIAHQDWFMLDTPPPDPSLLSPSFQSPTPVTAPSRHNAYAQQPQSAGLNMSSRRQQGVSEDDRGWKSAGLPLSEQEIRKEHERIKNLRRRTTLERGESMMYSTLEEHEIPRLGDTEANTFDYKNPPSTTGGVAAPGYTMGGAVGVTRSRTLPSSRKRGTTTVNPNPGASTPDVNILAPVQERVKGVLLKKQKRASYLSPSTTSASTTIVGTPPVTSTITQATTANNDGNMGRTSTSHLQHTFGHSQ